LIISDRSAWRVKKRIQMKLPYFLTLTLCGVARSFIARIKMIRGDGLWTINPNVDIGDYINAKVEAEIGKNVLLLLNKMDENFKDINKKIEENSKETNRKIEETNIKIEENSKETNRKIEEINIKIEENSKETNIKIEENSKETNRKIEETNKKIEETNKKIDLIDTDFKAGKLALIFLSTLLTAFVGSNLFTFVKDVLKMN
jgi:methyl-accepting chemotaxis protein